MDDLLLLVTQRGHEETILFCPGDNGGLHMETDSDHGVYLATQEEEDRLWAWLHSRRQARGL